MISFDDFFFSNVVSYSDIEVFTHYIDKLHD